MTTTSPLEQARQLRDQGRHLEAYACLQHLSWPQLDLEPYLLKGVLERHLGRLQDAQCSLALALGHPGHHGLACYELGELQRSLGQFDAAASWFLAALRHAPQHPWIHQSLQFTRFGPELLPLVAAEYQRHCQTYPGDAMAMHLLAELQLRLEQKSAAMATARQAARLQLGDQEAWLAGAEVEPTPPDFVIIGVPKGGTTSLLQWLGRHPQIWGHPRKELHFFNGAWDQGPAWYAAQFPVFASGSGIRRGEATPNYFLHPQAPERLAAAAPHTKLILLLRDPLQRAISWIEHLRRHEGVQGSTEELLLAELEQLQSNPAAITGSAPAPPGHQALLGSCYDAPLTRWQAHCHTRLLVLRSEALFQQPEAVLARCGAFLGISAGWPHQPHTPQNVNPQPHTTLSPKAHRALTSFLAEHNRCLTTFVCDPAQMP
jgi:tetratricopeptide (TPR) repeat protein